MANQNCLSNDDPDMRGCRARNDRNGQLRAKRGDTLVGTIETQYGVDLGMRSDARLDTALDRYGVDSLSQLLKVVRNRR